MEKQGENNKILRSSSWDDVYNTINYNSFNNNSIPHWYDRKDKLIAKTSQDEAVAHLNYMYCFDDYNWKNFEKTDELAKLLNKYKNDRIYNMKQKGYKKR